MRLNRKHMRKKDTGRTGTKTAAEKLIWKNRDRKDIREKSDMKKQRQKRQLRNLIRKNRDRKDSWGKPDMEKQVQMNT